MDKPLENSSKMSEKEEDTAEESIRTSPSVDLMKNENEGENGIESEKLDLDSGIDSLNGTGLESVTDANPVTNSKSRKSTTKVKKSDAISKVNTKEEDLLSLPHKRPRTTALSRSYREQKQKSASVAKEDGEKISDDSITDKLADHNPVKTEGKNHSTSLNEPSTDGKDGIETPGVTRSRYGRIRKKRPVSPPSPESHLAKDIKTRNKEANECQDALVPPAPVTEGEEKDVPCEWEVGDLVWARLSGFPWWPGLIEKDPLHHIHTKIKGIGHRATIRMYHVLFLGSAVLRGWLAAKSLMLYEGKEKYEEQKSKAVESAPPKAKAKIVSAFSVKPSQQVAWHESVAEAEAAWPLTREERQLKHGVDYFTDSSEDERKRSKSRGSTSCGRQNRPRLSSTSSTKRERHLSKSSQASSDKTKFSDASDGETKIVENKPIRQKKVTKKRTADKRNVKSSSAVSTSANENAENSDEDFELTASPKKSKLQSQPYKPKVVKGNFDLFLQKHKEEVKKEHPDQPDESIENFLRKQWEIMTDAQRARYRSHFGGNQEVSKQKSSRSPKGRSPSKSTIKQTSKRAEPARSKPQSLQRSEERQTKVLPTSSNNAKNHASPRKVGCNRKLSVDSRVTEPASQASPTSNTSAKICTPPRKTGYNRKLSVDSRTTEPDSQGTPEGEDFVTDTLCSPVASDALTDASSILEGVVHTPSSSGSQRNNGDFRVERICLVCEKPSELANDVVKCEGMCFAFFHVKCIGMKKLPSEGFKCEECRTGNRSCFACKEEATDLRRCTVAHCGRFYHEKCLQKNHLTRMEGKSVVCPLHVCVSCAATNPKNPWANKGRVYRCIRCPTAYHTTDCCMGAGSIILSQGTMLCPRHYKMNQKHLNVNWCFLCSVGGSLLCCESCPAAFHVECLEIEPPEGNYFCDDCVHGQQPKFGDIVWVKLGCYRWWPAEIQNPKSVPDNIQSIGHKVGEFPVFFFGSHDYYWTNRSRVYHYQEGDRGTKDGAAKGLAKVFETALQEAAEAYKALKEVRESREAQEQERINQRPPPYRQIKINKPVGKVQQYTSDHLEHNPCECDPNASAPCSSDTECLNRMLMIECDAAVCAAGEQCHNQRLQKRQYVPTVPIRTEGKGWGLKALVDIKKGDFVIEYVGEVIDEEECRQRMAKMHEQQCTDFYFLTIDKDRIIDAGPKGNLARYMNHSCQPNCETQKWTVNGDTRVGLFAIDDVPSGKELTFNYNLDCLGNEKSQCCCGAPNCSGYIGDRPKVTNSASLDKKSRESSAKKRKKRRTMRYDKREHEDECFRCGEGGELVMCDKKSCSKAYHLSCLSLIKPPHGRWECPWHHCDVCGRPSVILCAHCPNSFCQDHHEDLISVKVGGIVLCYDHGSQPSEHAAKLLQMRSIAFQNMTEAALNGDRNSTSSEQMASTPVHPSDVGELSEASPLKHRRGRSTKDSLQSMENGCADQNREESADEALSKRSRGKPGKGSVPVEHQSSPLMNGGGSEDDCQILSKVLPVDTNGNAETSGTAKRASSDKRNTRAAQKEDSRLSVNGRASPLKRVRKTTNSASPSPDEDDETDFEVTAKPPNLLSKSKKIQSPAKTQSPKTSTSATGERHPRGSARPRKASVNGSVPTTSRKKSVEHILRRTRRRDVVVVEERMAVLNGNLTVECVQPEVVTIKEDCVDDATAIITVENLSGVGALDLKPYVQKYKLENGELSLEECDDSEIEVVEELAKS